MPATSEIQRAMVAAAMARDFTALRALYHDDYVYTAPDGSQRHGPDGAVALVETYTSAFPDFAVTVLGQHPAGETASIMEFRATGTHEAELEGIAPTSRRIDFRGVNVVEVSDGLIVREREYYDNLAIMQQLGVAG